MKKRTMKKWIPKNTSYCYWIKNGQEKICKWWRINLSKDKQENGYCVYCNIKDWENYSSLLWDKCKECYEKID